ncbi:alpha/beta hydrolase [Rhizorhapis suberifaciens]|uniref:Acetyl esterase/lipase n=1 Tax=Rhizorhapis suberifaciens TaxID=13656 RepID=A0A840HRT1_9SPHN|nr:alpha/beta hydrolase [Rhizorhapis suberifaciens]MBB4640300.1 acetyl esterase/lipase [Rhizorhapis suberifaciens]
MRLLAPIILSLAAAVPAARDAEGPPAKEYAYGENASQRLDFWPGRGKKAPVILYVHGGGWSQGDKAHDISDKAEHFVGQGYAFASMNYRLVPQATVEQQAADVANAVAWLRNRTNELGIHRRRMVLMGHSAGAHLVALIATDPAYLKAAGVPLDAIAGVVLLDGAAYHVPTQLHVGGEDLQRMRRNAFGDNIARHMRLSPDSHTAKPNVRRFLILHVNNPSTIAQSRGLAVLLKKAGTQVTVRMIRNSDHMRLNRHIGDEGDEATKLTDAFLVQAVR